MDTTTRVLLMDGDPIQRSRLTVHLQQAGYGVLQTDSMAHGRTLLEADSPHLLVLALDLPDGEGLAGLRELLKRELPVIATGRPELRIAALELGADDFLDQPCDQRELLARIQNLLRRCWNPRSRGIRFGPFHLDLRGRRLLDATGREIVLTRGEFELLAALAEAGGRVIRRSDLSGLVSSAGAGAHGRSVDVLVSRLRHKLEADPRNPSLLLTAPGLGYRLRA